MAVCLQKMKYFVCCSFKIRIFAHGAACQSISTTDSKEHKPDFEVLHLLRVQVKRFLQKLKGNLHVPA